LHRFVISIEKQPELRAVFLFVPISLLYFNIIGIIGCQLNNV